jgi:hypothetical protein
MGGPFTPPSADPFYVPPAGYASAANGKVLAARKVTATLYGVPLPVQAWQLLYRSEDSAGAATAEVTTVMVPNGAWAGSGKRPVVSYQTAEDSVASQCAPSYAIRAGLVAIDSNAEAEVGMMASLLSRGWAVVSSDYEGPHSQFLAGRQAGHGVLDGIRAALSYPSDGLDVDHPVALWGYSGGAFASSWAAELQPGYAPSLHFTAVAIGGDPADLVRSFEQVDGTYGAGLVFGGIIGLERSFPDAGIGSMFTPVGQRALSSSAHDCTDELIARHLFAHVASYTYDEHPFTRTPLSRVLAANSPLGHGAPRAGTPVYDYHANPDELVPVAVGNDLVAAYCAAGVRVQEVRYAYGEHNATLLTGAPEAEQFLADRFAGKAIVGSCPATAPPRRSPTLRRTVIKSGSGPARARPRSISLGGHPRVELTGLRWRRWGEPSATARGRLFVSVCAAYRSCPAHTRARSLPATVTVSRLRRCFVAERIEVYAYTRLRYTLERHRLRGLPRRSTRRLACPRR